MLHIDVLLTENELAEELAAALEQRFIPEKFFYWFPLSVRAWLDLCREAQPYKNFSRSYRLVERHAKEIADSCRNSGIEVVGLGAGQGDKDLLVLQALGAGARYRPVDSSQALLEIAARRAADAGFETRGLKADLDKERTTHALLDSAGAPRLFLLLGNTLGGFHPPDLLRSLRVMVRPSDRLLLDGEIFSGADTMAGYDNPVNRRFAFAPLASLGLEEPRDGALIFESGEDAGFPGLHFVSKHFRAARRLEIPVGGQPVTIQANEALPMSRSYKYSRDAFSRLLRDNGFSLAAEYPSDDQRFLLALTGRQS